MKKVTVVILNFQVKKETLACVKSVLETDYQNLQIIVVDNNSNDNLEEELKKFDDVIFIQNKKNIGFTGGNNVGIKYALSHGADCVFVLNPDTEISPGCMTALVNASQSGDILGPKIYFADTKKIWFAGGQFDVANVLGTHRGLNEEDNNQYNLIEDTDYVSGAAFFVKRQVFEKIGFFDERYFLYYEDADFCIRAKRAGFKVFYVPTALVFHKNARSTGLGSPLQDYFITRNRMLLASKFLPFRTRFALLREALKNIGSPARRLAFFDFLIGNFGQGSFKIKL